MSKTSLSAFISNQLTEPSGIYDRFGHRITTHPGQFTQLGSPNPNVIAASIRELAYHDEMLSGLHLGKHTIKIRSRAPSGEVISVSEEETDADADAVCIVHGGGVYGDKAATIERIKATIEELPTGARKRLVLENDELCYTAEDLLPICETLDVPLVFGTSWWPSSPVVHADCE